VNGNELACNANITYLARSFLDYRVPVFEAVDSLTGGRLHVVYSTLYTPERAQVKLRRVLGERAIALSGEKTIGRPRASARMANSSVCFTYQPKLVSAIASTKPDVLLSDEFFKWTVTGIIYRLIHGVPLVVCYERTFHTERDAQWYRVAYRRLALKLVDAVCCDGRLCAEYTRWLGAPESCITTGHMAADTDSLKLKVEAIGREQRDAIRTEMNIRGLAFLYVGQLIKRKGVEELLAGWARFERTVPGRGTLLIVGGGSEAENLRAQVAAAGLQHVRFAGPVDYDGIASYYAAADVFVMPTLEDNWSLVVPEAMACGLPILCSRYNGCWPELVHAGGNGWVFDPLDSSGVFRALERCLANAPMLPRMGRNSQVVIGDHTPQKAAEAILRGCTIAMGRWSR
jgi:glycosyltransferase involved in cell wall biosynthesis